MSKEEIEYTEYTWKKGVLRVYKPGLFRYDYKDGTYMVGAFDFINKKRTRTKMTMLFYNYDTYEVMGTSFVVKDNRIISMKDESEDLW